MKFIATLMFDYWT